jgi:uncharacterized RDD family membrane protein YckC
VTDGAGNNNRASPPPASTAPVHPLDDRYYVRGETEAYGPYGGFTVKDMIEQGRLLPTTGIARVGATEWTEVKDHPFFGAIRRGAAAPQSNVPASGAQAMRLPGAPGSYQPGGPAAYQDPSLQSVQYAGFWIRLVAYILDTIFLSIASSIVGGIIGAAVRAGSSDTEAAAQTAAVLSAFVGIVMFVLYQVLFLRSGWQATPGKRLLGLKVVTTTGERIGGLRALGRACAYFLSGIILYIGFMMIGWNKEKKALHDIICDTRVIYAKR